MAKPKVTRRPKTGFTKRQKYKLAQKEISAKMGANKGKTVRALSRHAAGSQIGQAYANSQGTTSTKVSYDLNLKGYPQRDQDKASNVPTNKPNKNESPKTSSDSILDWIN